MVFKQFQLKKTIGWPVLISAMICLFLTGPCVYAADDFSFGVQLFDRQRFKEAKDVFQKVLKTNPRNTNAIYYLAASLQNTGDLQNATKFYNHLVKVYPTSAGANYARAALKTLAKSGHTATSTGSQTSSRSTGNYIPDQESIPFRRDSHNHLTVSCRINGRNLNMTFDTGATDCVLGKNHLQNLGINPPKGAPTNKLRGIGGSVSAWEISAMVQLGNIRKRTPLIVIEKMDQQPLLGQGFFGDLKYDIDNSSGTIRFSKPGSKSSYVPHDTINVPFVSEGANIVVQAKVNGKPMKFYFDSGAQGTSVTTRAKQSNGSTGWTEAGMSKSRGVGGDSLVLMYKVNSIELGSIRKRNMKVAVNNGIPIGLLGQDFFGRRRFIIDKEKSVIRFFR